MSTKMTLVVIFANGDVKVFEHITYFESRKDKFLYSLIPPYEDYDGNQKYKLNEISKNDVNMLRLIKDKEINIKYNSDI